MDARRPQPGSQHRPGAEPQSQPVPVDRERGRGTQGQVAWTPDLPGESSSHNFPR